MILGHILMDERRNEILRNHQISLEELKARKLKFYDNVEDIINEVNEN